MDDADAVSITVKARRGRYTTLASSDDRARQLDDLQYALTEGPCVDAAADHHEWQRSGDVARDARWPRWAPQAAELGVRSMLSVRLLSAGTPIGALNFYAYTLGRFGDAGDVDFAVLVATHVAIALTSSREVANLQTALHSRHLIGIAQGMLIERYGLDIDQSFDMLRRYSSTTNTKLAEVAAQIVATGRLPELPDQRPS